MKNKKAIIILMMLILFTLISSVSANDVNTTEISASATEDVISIDNDYLVDESADFDNSRILNTQGINSTNENDVINELKENVIDNSNNNFNKEILSSSNSEIVGMSNDNDLLTSSATYSFIGGKLTINFDVIGHGPYGGIVPEGIYVGIYPDGDSFSTWTGIEWTDMDVVISSQGAYDDDISMYYIGVATINNYNFQGGKTYHCYIGEWTRRGDSRYVSGPYQFSFVAPTIPTVTVNNAVINYAGINQKISGTVKSGSTNVGSGSITIKYGTKTIGSGTVSNGVIDAIISDSTFASPSTTAYDITVEYGGNSNYGSSSGTGKITVNKITPTISVGSQSIYYGQTNMPTLSGTVYSTTGNYYSGTVDLYINNNLVKSGISVSNAGNWEYTLSSLPDLSPGSYDVKVVYSGSTFTSGKTETMSKIYTVLQNEPTVTTGTYSVYYGQLDSITVSGNVVASNVANGYSGKINVTIGTQYYNDVTVNDDGSWSFTVLSTQFNPYTYDIKMEYSGNTYCKNKTITVIGAYVVKQNDPDITAGSITISYGQANNVTISGTVKNSNIGNVYGGSANITIGDATWNNVLVNDDGSWSLPRFNSTKYVPNTYNITVVYGGNNYVKSKSVQQAGTLTVNKGMLFVMATNTGNIDFGNSEIVSVSVMNYARIPIENISVKLTGDGIQDYLINTTNSEGKLTFTVSGLIRGQYNNWELEITGNEYYEDYPFQYPVNPFNVQSPLNVLITGISPNNSTFPEEIIITGYTDADSIPQGNVSIIIGGKTYTGLFDSNGNFTANLIGVKPGTYNNITAKYNPTVDEFYYRGVESTVSIQ